MGVNSHRVGLPMVVPAAQFGAPQTLAQKGYRLLLRLTQPLSEALRWIVSPWCLCHLFLPGLCLCRPCFCHTRLFLADTKRYLLSHLGWIAARAPKRVNRAHDRAHGPTKENRQNLCNFWIFPADGKNGPGGPQMGRGRFFSGMKKPCRHFGQNGF